MARSIGRSGGTVVLAVLAATVSGCYRYVPANLADVRPAEDVRLVVAEDVAGRLTREFGPVVTPRLEGELSPMNGDSVAFALWVGQAYSGTAFSTVRQTIPLGRTDIIEVYRRRLSVPRTTMLALGITAGVAILVSRLSPGERDGQYTEEPGPAPEPDPPGRILLRLPLFSIR